MKKKKSFPSWEECLLSIAFLAYMISERGRDVFFLLEGYDNENFIYFQVLGYTLFGVWFAVWLHRWIQKREDKEE